MFSLLSGRLSSGLAKVEEGDHIVYGNPVTSGTSGLTEATADVISSTTMLYCPLVRERVANNQHALGPSRCVQADGRGLRAKSDRIKMPLKHPLFGCNGEFVLLAAHDGPGMQPGRAEASPIKPKKLVSSSARTLCERVRFSPSLPSRIVTVAVKPDTSGTPGGTLSIAIRTGTRCAKRTQV